MSKEQSYGLLIIDKISITLFGFSLFNKNEPIEFECLKNQTGNQSLEKSDRI